MAGNNKLKRRGFVMTGGGAKGFYEAGVIHAFHITGMEFDVITGSSIGAMNSIFFAEYQYLKRSLSPDVQQDPEAAIEAMDKLVKAFHHSWFLMPAKRLIDDGEQGPLGNLKNDLQEFQVSLPQLTRIAWWWTDPEHGKLPPPSVWPAVSKLLMELSERVGGLGQVLRIFKDNRLNPFQEALRTYLSRFGLDKSLIPAGDDQKLKSFFTVPVTPLTEEFLLGKEPSSLDNPTNEFRLVDPQRTLRDYAEAQINVRLTRANYRTGRLEISTYFSEQEFVAYLERQAWRLQSTDPEVIPLGSFRLQIPGNPNAVNAALASGRFPGVFFPYPISSIYDLDRPENRLLNLILNHWLDDNEVEKIMTKSYQALHPEEEGDQERWQNLYTSWRDSSQMHDFFPRVGDMYIDGGAIDNTPSNSAVDATREWAEKNAVSRRDVELDLYVIFLGPEPKVAPDEIQNPAFYQVVDRTLKIQGAAKQSSDAVVVDTINQFGKRGGDLGETLLLLVESVKELFPNLSAEQQTAIQEQLREAAREHGLRGFLGKSSDGILDRIQDWGNETVSKRLPLQVNLVKIYPQAMRLNTLQFTDRLGYRKENALQMITAGCYDALWALREQLEGQPGMDEQDQRVLNMARKWMGGGEWPQDPAGLADLKTNWHCQRTACVFHKQFCAHGAKA
jgi:hypothetical protein